MTKINVRVTIMQGKTTNMHNIIHNFTIKTLQPVQIEFL